MRKTVSLLVSFMLMASLLIPGAALAGIESLNLSSYMAGAESEYRIQYKVDGGDLYQANNDYISVFFSDPVELPASIPSAEFFVNSIGVRQIRLYNDQRRIDLLVPSDLAVNQSVSVLIRSGAGIKNPSNPGRYAIGVMTSKSLSMSQYLYTITSGAVSSPLVEVSPSTPDEAAEYNISFNVSESGSLTGGADTISIIFPQEITLPFTISRNTITVNGRALDSGVITLSGRKLTFTVPNGVSVQAGSTVTVRIRPEAGIRNPDQPGGYRLSVATSRDTAPVASYVYSISGSSISNLWAGVSPTLAGAPAQYEINFKTSLNGSLRGGHDSITVTFPAGTTLPQYIPRSSVEVQGETLDTGSVTVDRKSVSFTVPSGIFVGPGKWVNVKIKSSTGIINPETPGIYNLKLNTSADQTAATSNGYRVAGKKVITLVVDSRAAFIDGKAAPLDVPATILNGRTLVPIRFVAESLGARVGWDEISREVTVSLDGKEIRLTVDSRNALVDGRQVILDAPAVIREGRTLVPIRFIAESFGGDVQWDNETRTVTIKK